MRNDNTLSSEESGAGDFERDLYRRKVSESSLEDLNDARTGNGPFFMDFEDGVADDPANYCLPADDRFPD